MTKILILFALCSMACGGMPDLACVQSFEAGGMTFCLEHEVTGINPDMVEDLVALTEQQVQKSYPQVSGVRDMLVARDYLVFVTSADIMDLTTCRGVSSSWYVCDSKYDGVVSLKNDFIVIKQPKGNPCFIDGALMHEILHTIDWNFLDGGADHNRQYFFGRYDEDTVEHKLGNIIFNELMPLYPEQCGSK